MDPQVFSVVHKVQRLLNGKKQATLSDTEIAYITGLLESIITMFSEPPETEDPGEERHIPRQKESFWKKLLP